MDACRYNFILLVLNDHRIKIIIRSSKKDQKGCFDKICMYVSMCMSIYVYIGLDYKFSIKSKNFVLTLFPRSFAL